MHALRRPARPVVSAWLLLMLSVPCPAPAQDSVDILKGVSRAARAGSITGLDALAQVPDAKAAELVLDLVGDAKTKPEVRARITEIVAAWPPGAGQDALAAFFQKKPDCGGELLQFYAALGLPALQTVFLVQLAAQKDVPVEKIKHPERHAAIVRALEKFPDQRDTVVAHLAGLLDGKAPHVLRVSAATALGGIRHANVIPALVPHVADAAIGDEAVGALYRLTGQDHGKEVDAWNTWLSGEGKGAELKMLSRDDLAKHREEQRLAAAQNPDNPNAAFYGLEFRAKNAVFILDCSGSMSGERIGTLKAQTTNLLNSLQTRSKAIRYAIITFDSRVDSCAGGRGLMDNDEASFKKSLRFVERMQATGSTAMVAALTHVSSKLLPDNNVDTIYFLSDGSPSDGTPDDVMALVSKMHYEHQVKIHTISITGLQPAAAAPAALPPKPSLLEQMAKHTGGEFKEL